MTDAEFHFFCDFLINNCGIELGYNKKYLAESRLTPLLQEFNQASIADLIRQLSSNSSTSRHLRMRVIDAMTTNETFWFREQNQFDELKNQTIPKLLHSSHSLKLWSAGSSSGQEPYSCAMLLDHAFSKARVDILATDISDTMIAQGRKARYTESALARGMPFEFRQKYFQRTESGYQLDASIMRKVHWQKVNLLDSYLGLGRFHIILCRNVLIYFSAEAKKDIVQRLSESLYSGGYLFLSNTENIPVSMTGLQAIRGQYCRFYQKIG
ncbi:MAG: protein-glutamate O-methyltransferase CheR [Methylococcales bacterium]|nr:protein-glutamate O-methyltransferase CheR [Methylococcales bacterium]